MKQMAMEMEKHIKVARAHRAVSWLAAFTFVTFYIILFMVNKEPIPILYYFYWAFIGGFSFLNHSIAMAAYNKKPWARNASRIVACFMLLGFPLGTVIGIYLLMNIWPATDEDFFECSACGTLVPESAKQCPKCNSEFAEASPNE